MTSSRKPEKATERIAAIADETSAGAASVIVIARMVGGSGDANPKSICPRGVPLQLLCGCESPWWHCASEELCE
jgi:hypothetical protein